jgi:hypothetical protein
MGASAAEGLHPKVEGTLIGEFHGLLIYGNFKTAKKTGKNRTWIQIRQREPKRYRVAESLAYMRSLDVQFEETIQRFPR